MKNATQRFLRFTEFLQEEFSSTSGEVFAPKRNKPLRFDPKKHTELAGELFNLISTAYSAIGGHIKVKVPEDVYNNSKWNFWEGIDIHGTEDFDIIMFGQKTKYGVKFSGVGHDGERDSKRFYINQRAKDLKKLGHYIEVSGKIAEILIDKYDVPVVDNKEEVEKVLGKKIDWEGVHPTDKNAPGAGWYSRGIAGGKAHHKILIGKPKGV